MSNKPTKDEIPYWAKFIAQNQNGVWKAFEKEPFFDERQGEWIVVASFPQLRLTKNEDQPDNDDWKQTLERVPQWKLYENRVSGFQLELRPYVPGEDLSNITVPANYRPQEGDMIGRNRFYLRQQSLLPQSKFTTYFGTHSIIKEIE